MIREDIPIFILFRALGIISDREIIQHICFDFSDTEMLEMLRPSLEDSASCQSIDSALIFIGKRFGWTDEKEKLKMKVRDFLDTQLLPHIGSKNAKRKAFFIISHPKLYIMLIVPFLLLAYLLTFGHIHYQSII